jgi:D-alanyl-D-alanine-carboxypeptidase/D-alanyl-D-alanine-endopeptidase
LHQIHASEGCHGELAAPVQVGQVAMALATLERLTMKAHGKREHGCLAVGVIDRDERHLIGYGESGAAASPTSSLFEIGSLTKIFTGLLLAEMAEDGLVNLDDRLASCFKHEIRLPRHGDGAITLASLAAHTAGLPQLPLSLLPLALGSRGSPYARITGDDMLRALAHTRLRPGAGKRYHYSDFGVGLLGLALGSRAGVGYEQAVRERLCAPLGLHDTMVVTAGPQLLRMALGYSAKGIPVTAWNAPGLAGAGALRSTAADLLRFVDLQLGVSPSVLAWAAGETQRPRVRVSRRLEVGLGWHISPLLGHWRMLWHDGGTAGFASFLGMVKETRVAVIVLANTALPVDVLGLTLLEALHQDRWD